MELDSQTRLKSYPAASGLGSRPAFWQRPRRWLARFLARYYLPLLLIQGMVILYIESREHLQALDHPKIYFISEVILISLLVLVFAVLTRALVLTLQEKVQAVEILRHKNQLSADLATSRDAADIAFRLSRALAEIVPAARTALYLQTAPAERFLPVETGADDPPAACACVPELDPKRCRLCLAQSHPRLTPSRDCMQPRNPGQPERTLYCLPLSAGGVTAGVLRLDMEGGGALSPAQARLVENLAPEISAAILVDKQKKAREEERLAQQIRTTQLDLARDLHDTIGQNVSYLRLKLDHLAEQETPVTDTRGQLAQMRNVADETYDMVRGLLTVLQTESAADLPRLFSRHAAQVTERSGIDVQIAASGAPQSVSPDRLRHLFYIYRECLNNIEKHAHAAHARVELIWQTHRLEMTVSDDGGGFDPAQPAPSGHYGLTFIRQRAAEINGTVEIQSSPGRGSRIAVCIPCA